MAFLPLSRYSPKTQGRSEGSTENSPRQKVGPEAGLPGRIFGVSRSGPAASGHAALHRPVSIAIGLVPLKKGPRPVLDAALGVAAEAVAHSTPAEIVS